MTEQLESTILINNNVSGSNYSNTVETDNDVQESNNGECNTFYYKRIVLLLLLLVSLCIFLYFIAIGLIGIIDSTIHYSYTSTFLKSRCIYGNSTTITKTSPWWGVKRTFKIYDATEVMYNTNVKLNFYSLYLIPENVDYKYGSEHDCYINFIDRIGIYDKNIIVHPIVLVILAYLILSIVMYVYEKCLRTNYIVRNNVRNDDELLINDVHRFNKNNFTRMLLFIGFLWWVVMGCWIFAETIRDNT